MRMMISATLLSAIVSLLVGCETSNQSYSGSGRVIDLSESSKQTAPDYGAAGRVVVNEAPRAPAPSAAAPILKDEPLSDGELIGRVPDVSSSLGTGIAPVDEAYESNTLIGGVPDDPTTITSAGGSATAVNNADTIVFDQGQSIDLGTNGALLAANESSPSGNWLVVDSAEAKADVSSTAATQKALDSSSQVVYQNKMSTTAGPDKYAVVQGDTLYSIAFRYGLDYHNLAKINKIDPPYNLKVGQVLILNLKAAEAPVYVVQKGDTLYSIARKNGQSVSFLAGVNNLEPPYNLRLGQKIKLSRDNSMMESATTTAAKESTSVPVAGQQPQVAQKPTNSTTASAKPVTPPKVPAQAQTPIINSKTRNVSGVTWSWPTGGRVIEKFSTAEQGNKGIDIAGNRGQPILSAADGQVVYAGNALRGFGNLVIINHTNEYLSAYAHNDVLLVKEGQKVKRGQQIARMGSTDASSTRLHFEIRYRGQSVNPVSYLPK